MEIFDKDAELLERRDMAQLQLERLQATLHRVYKNVKFYKKKFEEAGFLAGGLPVPGGFGPPAFHHPGRLWPGATPMKCSRCP